MDNTTDTDAELLHWRETDHLYHFATLFVTGTETRVFSDLLFSTFCRYYVTGFKNTVYTVLKSGIPLKKMFYTSSVCVDSFQLNMREYAAAKAAGGVLCTFIERDNSGLIVYKPCLPMVSTDLTASIGSKNGEDPVPIMLEYIRRLRDEK